MTLSIDKIQGIDQLTTVSIAKDYELAVKFHNSGMLEKAGTFCRKVISKKQKHAHALHLMGLMAHQEGDLTAAVAWYRKAVTAKPDFAEAHNSLGSALLSSGQLDEAVDCFRRSISIRPDYTQAVRHLCIVLRDCGLVAESNAAHRRALATQPAWHEARSSLLLNCHYSSEYDPIALLQEHRLWDHIHAGHLANTLIPHDKAPVTNRRLRIGIVSPDLKDHPVARFLLAFLKHYDREKIELFAYPQVTAPDEWTNLISEQVNHWHSLEALSDTAAADLIRSDGIDILIDLAGHTSGNRLLVFARKPAPIQVTYLGYPGTTGLAAMDYRITDAFADPPGMTEDHHSEQLIRLPRCAWCYSPNSEISVSPSPASQRGYITFGCFNNLAKVNERMLLTWGRILKAIPNSRMLFKAQGFRSLSARKRTKEALLLNSGITADRLDFRGPEDDYDSHIALYREIDIALDTFPYHGTTTTCEALWMGVPVVTLAGRSHVSRVGLSLLNNVGLPELVADSEDEYVRIAVALAANPERLSDYHSSLRGKMKASGLLDASSFAKEMESAFQQMWDSWNDLK